MSKNTYLNQIIDGMDFRDPTHPTTPHKKAVAVSLILSSFARLTGDADWRHAIEGQLHDLFDRRLPTIGVYPQTLDGKAKRYVDQVNWLFEAISSRAMRIEKLDLALIKQTQLTADYRHAHDIEAAKRKQLEDELLAMRHVLAYSQVEAPDAN